MGAIPFSDRQNLERHYMSYEAFYFGAWDSSLGHYTYSPDGVRFHKKARELPWSTEQIDGKLAQHKCKDRRHCGCSNLTEGIAFVHHRDGWTALGFWDRSVDNRPGSNSNFFFKGTHTFSEMKDLASKHFPNIVSRFKFEIIDGRDFR